MNLSNDELNKIRSEDGEIEPETVIENGQIYTRHYHKNGQVSLEIPIKNKLVDGTVRQWNDKGTLLGSYSLRMGTGKAIEWHSNGKIKGVAEMINGIPNGKITLWEENGDLISEGYMFDGKLVSSALYRKLHAKRQSKKEG